MIQLYAIYKIFTLDLKTKNLKIKEEKNFHANNNSQRSKVAIQISDGILNLKIFARDRKVLNINKIQ